MAADSDSDPSAAPFGGSWNAEAQVNAADDNNDDDDDETATFPPLYESGEDFDKATEHKIKASDYKMDKKWDEALLEYTAAIQAAPPSALLYANRATVLLELHQFKAAQRDCNVALLDNPDSAKALRIRGLARKELGLWEQARHDLSESQTIDYDPDTVEPLKEVTHQVQEMEKEKVTLKLEKEAKLKQRAEEIKKAQEEAKREAAAARSSSSSSSGGMPRGMPGGGMGGGMPGGMPGGMGGLMEVCCCVSCLLVCVDGTQRAIIPYNVVELSPLYCLFGVWFVFFA
jgi:suppressor of tumorigenicity protein 13